MCLIARCDHEHAHSSGSAALGGRLVTVPGVLTPHMVPALTHHTIVTALVLILHTSNLTIIGHWRRDRGWRAFRLTSVVMITSLTTRLSFPLLHIVTLGPL